MNQSERIRKTCDTSATLNDEEVNTNIVKRKECETAKEFLNSLQGMIDENSKCDTLGSRWVFRGQADSTWRLVPSAWRNTQMGDAKPWWDALRSKIVTRLNIANQKEEVRPRFEHFADIATEIAIVSDFARMADDLGLALPENVKADHLGKAIQRILNTNTIQEVWTLAKLWKKSHKVVPMALFEIAQHHGVPTRLLDWSFSPEVAALFAIPSSCPTVEHCQQPNNVCVWALRRNVRLLKPYRIGCQYASRRSDHHYLHAQHGMFTHLPKADGCRARSGKWPDFLETVEMQGRKNRCPDVLLIQFTLPKTEVKELMSLLYHRSISLAHLQPSFDNIVNCLKDLSRRNLTRDPVPDY